MDNMENKNKDEIDYLPLTAEVCLSALGCVTS